MTLKVGLSRQANNAVPALQYKDIADLSLRAVLRLIGLFVRLNGLYLRMTEYFLPTVVDCQKPAVEMRDYDNEERTHVVDDAADRMSQRIMQSDSIKDAVHMLGNGTRCMVSGMRPVVWRTSNPQGTIVS
jgi:hypothetical protein